MHESEPHVSMHEAVGAAEGLRKEGQTLEDTLDELAQLADAVSPEDYVEIVRGLSANLTEEQKEKASGIVAERVRAAREGMNRTESAIKQEMVAGEVEEIRNERNFGL